MKFAINTCFGGYGLKEEYAEFKGMERNDPRLIAKIEEVGVDAIAEDYAEIAIVSIPDDYTDWELDEYDGYETLRYVQNGKICYAEESE